MPAVAKKKNKILKNGALIFATSVDNKLGLMIGKMRVEECCVWEKSAIFIALGTEVICTVL